MVAGETTIQLCLWFFIPQNGTWVCLIIPPVFHDKSALDEIVFCEQNDSNGVKKKEIEYSYTEFKTLHTNINITDSAVTSVKAHKQEKSEVLDKMMEYKHQNQKILHQNES